MKLFKNFLFISALTLFSVPQTFAGSPVVFKGASYGQIQRMYASGETSALKTIKVSNISVPEVTPVVQDYGVNPKNFTGQKLFEHLNYYTQHEGNISFKSAKVYMYTTSDNTIYKGKHGVRTVYSQIFVEGQGSSAYDYNEGGKDLNGDGYIDPLTNAEHIWPQSFFNKQKPMVSDLHSLIPTFSMPNIKRSTNPFTKVTTPVKYQVNSGSKLGNRQFEPCDQAKGNVARAMLYFIVRYYNKNIKQGNIPHEEFWTDNVDLLLQWNRMDPPDAEEIRRNDFIEQFQGNRNPFVDDPSLADKIGASVFKDK